MRVFNELDISILKSSYQGLKDYRKFHGLSLRDLDDNPELEIPYILTDNLCNELSNLEYYPPGKVEQVSHKIPKDKFAALMYGLWWIKMQERELFNQREQFSFQCFVN